MMSRTGIKAALAALALVGMALLFVGILYLAMPVPAGWGHPVLAMLSCGLVAIAVKPWLRAD
ncbi:hypothetical protein [Burkholderia alba]|uniref:hypothetical protein n=1 Tax=Burkholderia alba TaxID=2683677 RepID=UPI002B060D65|nr:hypothetical protein [Burkholderia alba]